MQTFVFAALAMISSALASLGIYQIASDNPMPAVLLLPINMACTIWFLLLAYEANGQ